MLHHEKKISMSQCDQKVCSFRLYTPKEVITVIDQQAPASPVAQARVTFFTTSARHQQAYCGENQARSRES